LRVLKLPKYVIFEFLEKWSLSHIRVLRDTCASMHNGRVAEGARLDAAQARIVPDNPIAFPPSMVVSVRVSREAGRRKRQVCFAR